MHDEIPLAPQVRAGKFDDRIGLAAHHRAQHVERKALRHFHGDGRRHGKFGSIHQRIDQNRTIVRERSGDAGIDFAWALEADSPHADGFGHGCEIRVLKIRADVGKAGGFLLEFDETEGTVVEYDHFDGKSELHQA